MADIKEVEIKPESGKKPRTQSGIPYPYYNLDLSIDVARMIHEKGGGECSSAHLASFLGYKSARSGTYLTRLSSAKIFGLVEGKGDSLRPTERALAIINPVMPDDRRRENINAFLGVPLYREIYERFKEKSLPPEGGLKNLLRSTLQVVQDRVNPAARVFYESAEQAGFFETSPDRTQLIPPLLSKGYANSAPNEDRSKEVGEESTHTPERPRSAGGEGSGGIHSALAGLLRELPPPGPWEARKKQQFLDAFTALFDFIYPSETKEKAPDAGASDASAQR